MDYYKLDENKPIVIDQKALILDNGKILVLKGVVEMGGKWELPGGLLEQDENLESGLKREIKEEIGLDIKISKLLNAMDCWHEGFKFYGGKIADAHFVILVFLCEKESGEIKLGREHEDFMWAGFEDLDKLEFGDKTIELVGIMKDMPLS